MDQNNFFQNICKVDFSFFVSGNTVHSSAVTLPRNELLCQLLGGHGLGCANKDLDGFLCKFIEYCRIVAMLSVIHHAQRNN